ncbi:DUF5750 family protein [Methanobacterium congolense]|uniref:Uncharacterized protein n=1 Tax=Methanobacterium congolense TaxID=118062 RepID=A0A1D3L5F8_9EURY|nr:DUF5750 family protein [Methanobacterium congolense]SCG86789.1 putative protein [Methanobacterium congolense]
MDVKIVDYGVSMPSQRYYVTYRVTGIDPETRKKLEERVEEETTSEKEDLIIKIYFEEKYYPLGSQEAQYKLEDFIAREEIEMTAYLTGLLED